MSIFGILFNYINFSKRVKEDKRGHFDVLSFWPSLRECSMDLTNVSS